MGALAGLLEPDDQGVAQRDAIVVGDRSLDDDLSRPGVERALEPVGRYEVGQVRLRTSDQDLIGKSPCWRVDR